MDLVLIRYAEIGLKGEPVRRRFEGRLVDNISEMLAFDGVEAIITSERGRVYVESDRLREATVSLTRVFGVASVSPAIRSSSNLKEISDAAARYSLSILGEDASFAIRARREGTHPYTSMDVARAVGAAVMGANKGRGIRVDLNRPDVEVYVEVRGSRSFIFSEILPGPGGLPLGTQGVVVARMANMRDCLAAWLMMKRGCQAVVALSGEEELVDMLRRWAPSIAWHRAPIPDLVKRTGALAVVCGHTLDELGAPEDRVEVPTFYPLVGMDRVEIVSRMERIC